MNDRSCNEVGEKRESGVLYEPPEPLFPNFMPRRRKILVRLASALILTAMIVAIWSVAASGNGEEEETDGKNGLDRESSEETDELYESEPMSDLIIYPPIDETEINQTDRNTEAVDEETTEKSEDTLQDGESEEACESETFENTPVKEVDLSKTEDGEHFIFNYSEKSADVAGLIDRGFAGSEKRFGGAPSVMIIHTHTSEKYYSDGTLPGAFNSVVAVGDELNTRLNSLGLTSIHCTVIHDGGDENAYLAARETIKTMLKIYPSIKCVIDLHRMNITEDGFTVKTFSGCTDGSAQIRLSVSAESGMGWQEDLALALALRRELNRGQERVCMPILLSSSRYNSDLCEYYIMVDIGSSGNTVNEARTAAQRLAISMSELMIMKNG